MAAAGSQLKLGRHFLAILQDSPIDILPVPVGLVQSDIQSLVRVAGGLCGDRQADYRVDLHRLRAAVLAAQLIFSRGSQRVGADIRKPDIAALVVQGAKHIVLHLSGDAILGQSPGDILIRQIGGQQVHRDTRVCPGSRRERETQAGNRIDLDRPGRRGEHATGGVLHGGRDVIDAGMVDLDGPSAAGQASSITGSCIRVVGGRDLPGDRQVRVGTQGDFGVFVRMDGRCGVQVQSLDRIHLNGLVVGEGAAQLVGHGSREDIGARLGELDAAAVIGQRPVHAGGQGDRLPIHSQGPDDLVLTQIFRGHLDHDRLIRVGELRQLEGQLDCIPDQDTGPGEELASKLIRHRSGNEMGAGFDEVQGAAVIAERIGNLRTRLRHHGPLHRQAAQVRRIQADRRSLVKVDVLRSIDAQVNDRVDLEGDTLRVLAAQFIGHRGSQRVVAVAQLIEIKLAAIIVERDRDFNSIALQFPGDAGREAIPNRQGDLGILVLVELGHFGKGVRRQQFCVRLVDPVRREYEVQVLDNADRDFLGLILTASLVGSLGNEGVRTLFGEADLREVRQVEAFVHDPILLDFPGDGLVFGGVPGIQVQGQFFVQVQAGLVSRSGELDDRQDLDGGLLSELPAQPVSHRCLDIVDAGGVNLDVAAVIAQVPPIGNGALLIGHFPGDRVGVVASHLHEERPVGPAVLRNSQAGLQQALDGDRLHIGGEDAAGSIGDRCLQLVLANRGDQQLAAGGAKLAVCHRVPNQLTAALGQRPLDRQACIIGGDSGGHIDVCLAWINADVQGDDRQNGDRLGLLIDLPGCIRIGGSQGVGPSFGKDQRAALIVEAVRHLIGLIVLCHAPADISALAVLKQQFHRSRRISVGVLGEGETKVGHRDDLDSLLAGVRVAPIFGHTLEDIGAGLQEGQLAAILGEASQLLGRPIQGQRPFH